MVADWRETVRWVCVLVGKVASDGLKIFGDVAISHWFNLLGSTEVDQREESFTCKGNLGGATSKRSVVCKLLACNWCVFKRKRCY
jgi:hypothetical protein